MTIARAGLIAALLALLCAVSPASRATTISGHVTDAGTGMGVAGASVSGVILFSPTSFLTTTNAEGYYEVNVSAGTYAATASADGYLQSSATLNASGDPLVADFVLTRPATLSGTVVAGVGFQTVELVPIDPGLLPHEASPAADGSYTITNIEPGHYYACAVSPYDLYLDQCYDGFDISSSGEVTYTTIALTSGEKRTGLNFSLHFGSSIQGTLHDIHTSTAIANAPVNLSLYSSAQTLISTVDLTTDSAGQFTLHGIAAGNYYLKAGARFVYSRPNSYYLTALHGPPECGASCTFADAGPFNVPAAFGVASGIDFYLQPGNIVAGKVTDSQSNLGIAGITVKTCEFGGNLFAITATTTTGVDGSYELAHVLGANGARIDTANSFGYVDMAWPGTPIYVSTNCDTLDGDALVFSAPDQALSGIDFSLTAGASIAGRVTALEFPAAGVPARIEVFKDNGNSLALAWTGASDDDGNYKSNGLQTGTYYVLAYLGLSEPCQVYSAQQCAWPGGPPSVDPSQATPVTFDSIHAQSGIDLQLGVEVFHSNFE